MRDFYLSLYKKAFYNSHRVTIQKSATGKLFTIRYIIILISIIVAFLSFHYFKNGPTILSPIRRVSPRFSLGT